MAENGRLRVDTKRSERIAIWLLAPVAGLLGLLFCGFVLPILFQHGAAKPKDFFTIGTIATFAFATGLIGLLFLLLPGIFHDALAVYEFTPQGVSKRSPFWEQRADWSKVAGWAIDKSDGIWWLLDEKERTLLSLRWHTLPNEQVPAAKAFVVDHLSRQFSATPSAIQTLLSRLRILRSVPSAALSSVLGTPLMILSALGRELFARGLGEVFFAVTVMAVLVAFIFNLTKPTSAFGWAKFLVCDDELTQIDSGVIIHLPSVRNLERTSDSIIPVGADGQTISIPSHLTALLDYLRARLPSEWRE